VSLRWLSDGGRATGRALREAARLAWRSVAGARAHGAAQLAAAIAYHVLFSIFPLVILLTALAGLVASQDTVRGWLVDTLLGQAGLSGPTRAEIEQRLRQSAGGLGAVGLLGLLGLAWSATAMMGALRHGVNVIWGAESRRGVVRGKLLDIALVLAVWLLIGASAGATLGVRVIADTQTGRSALPGPLLDLIRGGAGVLALLLPVAISFAALAVLYRVLPAVPTRLGDVWPGALLAALLLEIAKNALAYYFTHLSSYGAVYGSLGGVVSFLLFVYVGALVVLIGAEGACEWSRRRAETRAPAAARPAPAGSEGS
jgi:membrane protein